MELARGRVMTAPRKRVRVKTAKRRTVSSKRWLERQLNDPYVARARQEGLRSRAAFKLIELDDKYRFLKPGMRVGALDGRGHVLAIDVLDIGAVPGVEFLKLDFLDAQAAEKLKDTLGGGVDVVLSDMAANATGHRQTDHLRIMALVEAAAAFAGEVLKPGGTLVAKVLQGGTEASLLAELKRDFTSVKHVKPAASRQESAELYLLATGFRHPRR
jgi:23S rRNA (uridine2552-2'-O)-methyltransferase